MTRLKERTFRDRTRALREIGELSRALTSTQMERLDQLLVSSPDPEDGLHYCARMLEQHAEQFLQFVQSPSAQRALIAVFTHSHFLSEEAVQQTEWMAHLFETDALQQVFNDERFREEIREALPRGLPAALEFARFRRRQILRILVRDVLGLAPLPEITGELTALADAIVETALLRLQDDMALEYGMPCAAGGRAATFSVIALGKMGGQELNYSSDIDLMFLYSENGETAGPNRIANKEFFRRLANRLTDLLSTHTSAGMCYRVDLRLRPDGSQGEVCISLEAAREYYSKRARDWELQMLIKARVAAGDRAAGRALLDFVEPRTYATTLDFSLIESLSATRERLNEKLAKRDRFYPLRLAESIDIKLRRGGIRDIEFLVQCLQRLHGGVEPWVRHGGTMLSLARLQDKGFISGAEFGRLASAYQFLRQVEHRLQCVDDRQTHALPVNKLALNAVAARIPGSEGNGEWLLAHLHTHFANVTDIYERVVHSGVRGSERAAVGYRAGHRPSSAMRALEQRAPQLAAAVARGELQRGYRFFETLTERVSAEQMGMLEADAKLTGRVMDLFEHSPYFAEEVIRTPELLSEIGLAEEAMGPPPSPAADLRRWYRRGMTRIQAASICLAEPIFETLARTSALADGVIARAYKIAVAETCVARPPRRAGYAPGKQMWVIALGRLGMLEFDLASDADLVFVLADTDAEELEFWTRVAQRLADFIGAYTGEGFLFSVDSRLRPNGIDGPLVRTEQSFKEYFENSAAAWEGITYMKSRVVAGDLGRAQVFLHQLQQIDWKRYGQSGRSRLDLFQMRLKIEKEQGAESPFKSGRGGYYDIDFMLMYLRLKSAGVFYRVLNTPERIHVLESLGHLDKAAGDFLCETATLYRALDHGIRVMTGHAESQLPSSDAQVETLRALVKRWTPIRLDRLDELRSRTRAAFEKMFR